MLGDIFALSSFRGKAFNQRLDEAGHKTQASGAIPAQGIAAREFAKRELPTGGPGSEGSEIDTSDTVEGGERWREPVVVGAVTFGFAT